MKNIIGLILMSASLFVLQTAQATEGISPGETRTVRLSIPGGVTATGVNVSGRGVSARITNRQPGRLDVRLRANNNAAGGLRTINVQLPAGINRTPLYVFDINNARIENPPRGRAGQFLKVTVHLPPTAGRLEVSGNCTTSENGRTIARTSPGLIAVTKGHLREFYVTNTRNENSSCRVDLFQTTTHGVSNNRRPRTLSFNFTRDNSVPATIDAPRLLTANEATEITPNRSGNSPALNWTQAAGANGYLVRYRGPSTNNRWREVSLQRNQRLRNLRVGQYSWSVRALHDPANGSVLPRVTSDPSAVRRFSVQQRS
ncbi:MAG: hypothetical protein ABW092_21260 [Candidatus Thiodiazotropha sp.]